MGASIFSEALAIAACMIEAAATAMTITKGLVRMGIPSSFDFLLFHKGYSRENLFFPLIPVDFGMY
jgi:hypothetical protein